MSIVSVDNIQPIGSGTSVTVNNAATLVLNNANSTGVITATSFVGNLTGNVTGTSSGNAVLSGSTNNQVVTVTGANAITGESGLIFDGTALGIGLNPSSGTGYILQLDSSQAQTFMAFGNTGTGNGALNGLVIGNDTSRAYITQRENQNINIATNNIDRMILESDGDFRLSSDNANSNYGWIRGWQSSTGDMIISADHSASGSNGSNLIFRTRGTERARIQSGGLKMNGGSYIVECSEGGGGTTNNNTKIMEQRRWMWYGASSSTHTVARVAKAASGQPGDGDSQLAAWIVTYTARSMYGFNSDGGYSVMKMRTGRFDYNDNEVRFSTEQDTLGTGGGSQNPTIVFTDEGSGVVRISITNPSSTHSFGEINLMTYDCRITLPSG